MWTRIFSISAFLLFALWLTNSSAVSQIIIQNGNVQIGGGVIQPQNQQPVTTPRSTLLIQTPRETVQRLKTAQRLLKEKRYSEGVKILWDILLTEEDTFVPDNPDALKEEDEKPQDNQENAFNFTVDGSNNQSAAPINQHSLKADIQNILGSLPEEGRQASELIIGTEAQKALDEAVQSGSIEQLCSVAQKYFHTEAGYKATFLSGIVLLYDGQASSACATFDSLAVYPNVSKKFEPAFSVLWLNSLILSRQDESRKELVTQLRQKLARTDWTIQEKNLTGFENIQNLEEYLSAFDSVKKGMNFPYSNATPLALARWRFPMYSTPMTEALAQCVVRYKNGDSHNTSYNFYNQRLCTFEPVFNGTTLFSRTLFGLTSIDVQTGKRLWNSSADYTSDLQNQWERLGGVAQQTQFSNFLSPATILRLKYDFTYGSVQADEKNVYVIEDIWKDNLLKDMTSTSRIDMVIITQSDTNQFTTNRLAAYDTQTGKLKWHVGSAATQYGPTADEKLDKTSFLGTPLILGNKLYVIGETSDARIVLYELDSKTGKQLWSQVIGDSQNSLLDRMYNFRPVYQAGVLICPVNGTSLVGVDLLKRQLRWGFVAPDKRSPYNRMLFRLRNQFEYYLKQLEGENQRNISKKGYNLTLFNDILFYTPVNSTDTFVLNVISGEKEARCFGLKRENSYFPLSLNNTDAIILNSTSIKIINLENAQKVALEDDRIQQERKIAAEKQEQENKKAKEENRPAKNLEIAVAQSSQEIEKLRPNVSKTIVFPGKAELAGNPFKSGTSWFIPLSNNTLVEFDTVKREFVNTVKSWNNKPFGNICLLGDKIYSQNFDTLDCYDVKQFVLNELNKKNKEQTIRNLLSSGYLAWEKGDFDTAYEQFQKATQIAPLTCMPLLKSLIVEVVQKDYDKYESRLQEIISKTDSLQDKIVLVKLQIEGQLKRGKIQDALTAIAPLMDSVLDSKKSVMIAVDTHYSVEQKVFLGSLLKEIYDKCTDEQKTRFNQWVDQRLNQPTDKQTISWLECQMDFFYFLPQAKQINQQLYTAYVIANRLAEAELILRQKRFEFCHTPEEIVATWIQQAQLIQNSAPQDAAKIYRYLSKTYPNMVCVDGKTADEYVKSLGDSNPIFKAYTDNYTWSQGTIKVTQKKNVVDRATVNKCISNGLVKTFTNENMFFDGVKTWHSVARQSSLLMADKYGRTYNEIPLASQNSQNFFISGDLNLPWWFGEHVFFMLNSGELSSFNLLSQTPKPMWSKSYADNDDDSSDDDADSYKVLRKWSPASSQRVFQRDADKFSGIHKNTILLYSDNEEAGGKKCFGVDILTGQLRWTRTLASDEDLVWSDDDEFYTKTQQNVTENNCVFDKYREQKGCQYSVRTGEKICDVNIPSSLHNVTPKGIISKVIHRNVNVNDKQQYYVLYKLCSVKEQKVLWEFKFEFDQEPVESYCKELNLFSIADRGTGHVCILDVQTGKPIVDDHFEVMTQDERNQVVVRVKKLQKQIEEQRKKEVEEEKSNPQKREERLKREQREGRLEDKLPQNFNENDVHNRFDTIEILPETNSDGAFYMIVNTKFGYAKAQHKSQISGTPAELLHNVKIYKFNRQGQPLWKEPAIVKEQYRYNHIPTGLPFMLLGCNKHLNGRQNGYELIFLDKQTGRQFVYRNNSVLGYIAPIGDPDKNQVDILMNTGNALSLEYTSEPLPADAPMVIELKDSSQKPEDKEKSDKEKEQEKVEAGKDDPFE